VSIERKDNGFNALHRTLDVDVVFKNVGNERALEITKSFEDAIYVKLDWILPSSYQAYYLYQHEHRHHLVIGSWIFQNKRHYQKD